MLERTSRLERQSSPDGEDGTKRWSFPNKPKTFLTYRSHQEGKVVGLKDYGLDRSTALKRQELTRGKTDMFFKTLPETSIEELEDRARHHTIDNPFVLMLLGNVAAFKVMLVYLVTIETIISCCLTSGLTMYWYLTYKDDPNWNGSSMDFILLSFVVISPISAAIGMAYTRRERALTMIANFRSFSYHLYIAHCLWDWNENGGRKNVSLDLLNHCDAVLAQLVGIGDELSRFLSLPTTSRSRHRMTKAGRREASRTIEVAYHLFESMATQRITRLSLYAEQLKKVGLPSGEVSRVRQYERFISDCLEQLRIIKMYRTPQALRSFARIFTLLLPPFYAPAFAQVIRDTNSITTGIVNGVIVALALTGLFLSLEVLEDPFTAFLALDGIDVREEFEVLHFAQLIHTRDLIFPDAPAYPAGRRSALTAPVRHADNDTVGSPSIIGVPPVQPHHHHRRHSGVPKVILKDSLTASDIGDDDEEEIDLLGDPNYVDAELGMPIPPAPNHATVRESVYHEELLLPSKTPSLLNLSGTTRSHRRTKSRSMLPKDDTSENK